MSLFTESSLCLVPSGVKDGKVYSIKPTDGSGDLTFTRSNDTATRVASNGLIERVRTNLLERSSLIGDWQVAQLTVDSTAVSDPFGGTNAGRYTASGVASAYVFPFNAPSVTSGTTYTGSFYVKDVDANYLQLTFGTGGFGSGQYQNFDLTNGTKGSGAGSTSTITAVDNGWYRITLTATATASSTAGIVCVVIPSASSVRLATANAGQTFEASAYQMETGDIATDYIATTTAAVSVGPVANLPRLDYLDSSCPRLILEGQRTNLVLYSEQTDNAAWVKSNTTISANAITSPDGYTNADEVTISVSGGASLRQSIAVTSSTAYTFSFYVKRGTATNLKYNVRDLTNSVDITAIVDYTSQTSTTEWNRIVVSFTTPATCTSIGIYPHRDSASTGTFYVWGAQLEAGAYATSYVNTLNSAVTRGADAASKTGIDSLIDDNKGTLYMEVTPTNFEGDQRFGVSDSGGTNRIVLRLFNPSNLQLSAVINSSVEISISNSGYTAGNTYKIAGAWEQNNAVIYINGVQVAIDTNCNTSASAPLNRIGFDNGVGTAKFENPVKQILYFPTRLSNADLAALTA